MRDLVFTYDYGDFHSFLKKFKEAKENNNLLLSPITSNELNVIKQWEGLINEQIN